MTNANRANNLGICITNTNKSINNFSKSINIVNINKKTDNSENINISILNAKKI